MDRENGGKVVKVARFAEMATTFGSLDKLAVEMRRWCPVEPVGTSSQIQ